MKHLLLFLTLSLSIGIKAQKTPNLKEKNNQYALLNANNQVVSDYYSAIYDFEYGIAKVTINKKGRIVIPVNSSSIEIKKEYIKYLNNYVKEQPDNEDAKKWLSTLKAEEEKQKQLIAERKIALKKEQEEYKIDSLKDLARVYNNSKEYLKAAKTYEEYLVLKPEDYKYWNYLGVTYSNAENNPKAKYSYQKATIIAPDYFWPWHNLGKQYRNNFNNPDSAIICFTKALEIDSTKANTWNELGLIFSNKKEDKKAIINYRKALEIDPDNDAYWHNIAISYTDLKQYKKAISCHEKCKEVNEDTELYWYNLGYTYIRAGNYDSTIICMNKKLESKEYANPYAHIAFSYLKKGALDKAKEGLNKADSFGSDYSKIPFYWACYYSLQKEKEKAIDNLQKAIDKGFDDSDWIKEEKSLKFIRKDKRYKEIMKHLKE